MSELSRAPIEKRSRKPQTLFTQIFYQLHLWLGLGSALIALILCFSGAMLIVQIPIEQWVNRQVQQVQIPADAQRLPLETLVPQIQAETGQAFTGLMLPAQADAALILQEGRKATYINPYSGEVLGNIHQPTRDFFMFWFRLHRWLLLDTEVGRPITGVSTVIFIFLGLSGIWLWVTKALKQPLRALWLKKGVSWQRRNYDLHLVLGIYAVIPLLIMAYSGLFWTWREPFVQSTHLLLNGQRAPERTAPARSESKEKAIPRVDLPYTLLQEQAQTLYPYTGDLSVRFPEHPEDHIQLTKTRRETLRTPIRDRWEADAQSGELLSTRPYAELTRAEKVLTLIKDIHVGTILGGTSLWLYFLAVLAGATLPLTGAIHWGQRLWRQQKSARKKASKTAPVSSSR